MLPLGLYGTLCQTNQAIGNSHLWNKLFRTFKRISLSFTFVGIWRLTSFYIFKMKNVSTKYILLTWYSYVVWNSPIGILNTFEGCQLSPMCTIKTWYCIPSLPQISRKLNSQVMGKCHKISYWFNIHQLIPSHGLSMSGNWKSILLQPQHGL